ncbi:MAG: hydrolase [bacterium]|nr:hydrolase [bacterium]
MTTSHVTSKDGTLIAYDRIGAGPAVVLVDGALCHRQFGPMPQLAPLLAPRFTVFTYDRRGRGESSDTKPYDVAREIEDLEAVIGATGGAAYVLGISSGAALALEAASRGAAIKKLALYEPPFIVDDSRDAVPQDYVPRLRELIAQNRRGDAVKMFMRTVGAPRLMIALMPIFPMWSKLKAVAPTLPYDMSIMSEGQRGKPFPAQRWSSVAAPTLVIDGGKSPAWMRNGNAAVARAVPKAQYKTLPGQTHMVKPKVLAPVLTEYFAA